MGKVYIVAGRRTAIGSFLGSLSDVNAADMGAEVVKAVLADAKVKPEQVDELICGNILSAGLGQGVGRQIAVKAGIPVEVCAYSLNMLCGSGMKAVLNGVKASRTATRISSWPVAWRTCPLPPICCPRAPAPASRWAPIRWKTT